METCGGRRNVVQYPMNPRLRYRRAGCVRYANTSRHNPSVLAHAHILDTLLRLTILGFAGSGASGSSTIRAKLFVESGAPAHSRGGERSWPSQRVYTGGIEAPLLNAGDESVNVMAVVSVWDVANERNKATIRN